MKLIDLTLKRFGRLRVEARTLLQGKETMWLCRCDCGNTHVASSSNLRRGNVHSCGCLASDRIAKLNRARAKTGMSRGVNGKRTPTYVSWASMKARCTNPNATGYDRYGGRGIRVCKRWLGPHGFENFLADMGIRSNGMTLDRENNDGNYTPKNCRWATRKQQAVNRHDACGDRNGARKHPERMRRGERNPSSKLTASQVKMIRIKHADGSSLSELADRFSVNPVSIWKIIHHLTWRHV